MIDRIDFGIAPYALYDVIKAIKGGNCSTHHFDVKVGKEDGNLIIFVQKIEHNKVPVKDGDKSSDGFLIPINDSFKPV
jgi:hypothetical protein